MPITDITTTDIMAERIPKKFKNYCCDCVYRTDDYFCTIMIDLGRDSADCIHGRYSLGVWECGEFKKKEKV